MRWKRQTDDRHRSEKKETLGRVLLSNLFSLLKIFVVCLLIIYIGMNFLVRPIHVIGDSMHPTLQDGQWGLSSAFSAKFSEIERGDIVIAYEGRQYSYIVKRVIGLPGDTISCHSDVVYINGKPLDEPYLDNKVAEMVRDVGEAFTDDFEKVTLKEDEYFLMGDNRLVSQDSRQFGPFHKEDIRGVNILVLFPFSKFGVAE